MFQYIDAAITLGCLSVFSVALRLLLGSYRASKIVDVEPYDDDWKAYVRSQFMGGQMTAIEMLRYNQLVQDAKARELGLNLDGSPRKETKIVKV